MSQDPTIGLRAEFDDAQAQRRMKLYEERIKVLEAVHNTLSKSVTKGEKEKEDATNKSTDSIIKNLRKLRWEMVTLLFFVRMVTRTVKEMWETIAESAEISGERGGVRALAKSYEVDVGTLAAQLRAVSDQALSVQESLQVAQAGLLKDQGQFVAEYTNLWEAARVAAVTSGAEAQDVFSALVEDLVEGTGAATDAATPIFNLQYALQQYARAAGTTVEALDPMVKAQVILETVQGKTNTLLAEGAADALAQKDAVAELTSNWATLKSVWGTSVATGLKLTGVFEAMNNLMQTLTQLSLVFIASMSSLGSVTKDVQQGFLFQITKGLAGKQFDPFQTLADSAETFREVMQRGLEAYGMFSDEVDEGTYQYERFIKTPSRDYDPLVDHLVKRQQLLEQHNHQVELLQLRRDNRLEDLAIKHEQRLAQIERQAQYERARAVRAYERRVENETARHELKLLQEAEDHAREMLQAQEKYHLQSIQNERMYQYERGLLVAYGDVLAIEDLDARHALEQQSREENFTQQQRQDQDDYEAERRQRIEQFELELQILRKALDDQLEEIQIRTAERMLEAEEQRQEELRRIQRDFEQQLEEEQYRHEQSLEEWNQYWAKLAERIKIGSEEVTAILREFFGEGGEADQIVSQFADRWLLRTDIRSRLVGILGPETESSSSSTTRSYGQWGQATGRPYQFGGSGIVTSPGYLRVGEGHTPERFSVEPLAMGRSQLEVSWVGGAIPVRGAGSLAGANLSGLGDAITQGLVLNLNAQIRERRR